MSDKGERTFAVLVWVLLGAGYMGMGLWYLFTPGKVPVGTGMVLVGIGWVILAARRHIRERKTVQFGEAQPGRGRDIG